MVPSSMYHRKRLHLLAFVQASCTYGMGLVFTGDLRHSQSAVQFGEDFQFELFGELPSLEACFLLETHC